MTSLSAEGRSFVEYTISLGNHGDGIYADEHPRAHKLAGIADRHRRCLITQSDAVLYSSRALIRVMGTVLKPALFL